MFCIFFVGILLINNIMTMLLKPEYSFKLVDHLLLSYSKFQVETNY